MQIKRAPIPIMWGQITNIQVFTDILLRGEDHAGCPIQKLGPPKILTFWCPCFAVGSYASWQFLQDPFTQTHILTFGKKQVSYDVFLKDMANENVNPL